MSRNSNSGPSSSIFIGNVPYDAQEDELKELFSKVGHVTSVRVVLDKDTKQPKGYAFCDFDDPSSVQAAIEKLSNVEYNGRKLRIDPAERQLNNPGPRSLEDRPASRLSDRMGSGAPTPKPPDDHQPLPAVATVADRLARQRELEVAERARVAAAEAAERAEVGRLMETLTPQQVIHVLGEMQRLTLRAPEVARALVGENIQLALALQHALFLAGMVEEPPLPTEPEVRERARDVREKVWGVTTAPAPSPLGQGGLGQPMAGVALLPGQPPFVAVPGMPPMAVAPAVHFGAVMPGMLPGQIPTAATLGPPMAFAPPGHPVAPSPLLYGVSPPTLGAMPAPGQVPLMQAPVAAFGMPPTPAPVQTAVPQTVPPGPAPMPQEQRGLLERLVQLSPAEIDRLPHHTKVQLLDFLQRVPAQQQAAAPVASS